MSGSIRAADYVEHFDPELDHHRAWLLAVLEHLVAHELDNRPDKSGEPIDLVKLSPSIQRSRAPGQPA